MNPAPSLLEVRGLRKHFDGQRVLERIDLHVPRGSLVTILGPSGAGKSVLLKCLAGLVVPDAGEIRLEGRVVSTGDGPARNGFRRRCSYLFQGNALFDSLTAWENVALPLEQTTTLSPEEIALRTREALRGLDLEAAAGRYPAQLSGGMQKRLALARALVTRPEWVLFDEPTAGLDPLRRNAVFEMIVRHQREFGFTAVVVTHDLPEALAASDRVALLAGGRICFAGTPGEFNESEDERVLTYRDSLNHLHERLDGLRLRERPGRVPV